MSDSDHVKLQIFDEVSSVFQSHTPVAFDAINYFETKLRTFPQSAFTELRDVVSHFYDLVNVLQDPREVEKNVTEIKQHFRRAISETYQLAYDTEMSYLFQYYGKYVDKFKQFEKLLFLRKIHQPMHQKIKAKMKEAQNHWIAARGLKNNDLDTQAFKDSIEKFKNAFDSVIEIKDDVDELWNNFNQRSYILLIFILLFIVSTLAIAL